MENRVGDNTPLLAAIQKLEKTVDGLLVELGAFCQTLLPEERTSLTRGRLGLEPYLVRMANLAKTYGLGGKGVSADGLLNDIRTVTDLDALEQKLERALQLVRDTRALARSEATEAGLLIYGLAAAASSRIPEIEVEVRDMRAFLANGPRRKKPTDPTPS